MPDGERGASAEARPDGRPGLSIGDAVRLGYGTLVLSRARVGYRDALRGYAVLLDHAQVGSIRRGQTLRFEVPSGPHRLQLQIAWCSSPPLTAVVEPGSTVNFCCAPGGHPFDGLDDVLGHPDTYIALQQTPEPAGMEKNRLDRSGRVPMGAYRWARTSAFSEEASPS